MNHVVTLPGLLAFIARKSGCPLVYQRVEQNNFNQKKRELAEDEHLR
jgi:hypothetical protein